ncbi:hypothetical protein BH09ACT7_BH09ACT7_33260 [soil metagenome]
MNSHWRACEYTYRIHWSPGEKGYVAFVAEFPEMQSPPKATPQGALDALTTIVVERLDQLDADGEPRPPTLAQAG